MRAIFLNCTLNLHQHHQIPNSSRVVVTGSEDGAHHVISEISGGLINVGFTIPGQAWTYWNMGPGPGPSYSETDHKHDWSKSTALAAAKHIVAVATALSEHPIK